MEMKHLFTLCAAMATAASMYAGVLDTYTADPAGPTVESLNTITIVFPNAETTSPDFGISQTISLPDGTTAVATSRTQTQYDGKWVGYQIDFSATYTQEGEYTVTFPAGSVKSGDELSPEIVLKYTIEAATPEKPELSSDFTQGTIMLNEDWFGHTSSSLNFIDNDGSIFYNVFRGVNADHSLGNTSQYGQIFGDRIFVSSKQSYSEEGRTGGRFIVMDAKTLEFIHEFTELPCGDGRGCLAVSKDKAYVGGSKGFYALNLSDWTFGETNLAGAETQSGDMVRYGNRAFIAQQKTGVVVVDTDTDKTTLIELPNIAGFAVTADGSLYAACSDADAEFVKIDPVTLETETVNIEGAHGISSPWSTWKPAQICTSIKDNTVYYVSKGGWTIKTVSSYNFDTQVFTEEYVTLPESNQQIYGQISIDPATGNMVITATEDGYGNHYAQNWIYYFDTETNQFLTDKTIKLSEYYWFPSMMLYNDFSAPEVNVAHIELNEGEEDVIDLPEATTLAVGNKHLINYTVTSADPTVATVEQTVTRADASPVSYTVKAVGSGETTITILADYQGRISETVIPVKISKESGVEGVEEAAALRDVYTASGILVLRNATAEQISELRPGLYIIGGKKVMVSK